MTRLFALLVLALAACKQPSTEGLSASGAAEPGDALVTPGDAFAVFDSACVATRPAHRGLVRFLPPLGLQPAGGNVWIDPARSIQIVVEGDSNRRFCAIVFASDAQPEAVAAQLRARAEPIVAGADIGADSVSGVYRLPDGSRLSARPPRASRDGGIFYTVILGGSR